MNKPKEVWTFNQLKPEISGPFTVTGGCFSSDCWRFEDGSVYTTDLVFYTRKRAVEACFEHHEEEIKCARKELDKKERLLRKFYSEELYG